jgi:hypothetical protein
MATYVSEMFDELRDLLQDPLDANVIYGLKKLYLNRGISRLWPKIFRIQSTSITMTSGTYDYALPVGVADGIVISVELEDAYGGFQRFVHYDIMDGDEDLAGVFRLTLNPDTAGIVGLSVRVKYASPCLLIGSASYAAAQSEAWTGPDRAMHLPVQYAMSLITLRRLDARLDYDRYSTTQAANGVSDSDIMQTAAYWMGQFEAEIDEQERPLPIARD